MQRVHSLLVVSFLFCASVLFAVNTPTLAVADSEVVTEARSIAEKYWNAQKTSDDELFHSVTPQDNMKVVFAWTFIRDSRVQVEEGNIEGFRQNLSHLLVSYQKYKSTGALCANISETLSTQ